MYKAYMVRDNIEQIVLIDGSRRNDDKYKLLLAAGYVEAGRESVETVAGVDIDALVAAKVAEALVKMSADACVDTGTTVDTPAADDVESALAELGELEAELTVKTAKSKK